VSCVHASSWPFYFEVHFSGKGWLRRFHFQMRDQAKPVPTCMNDRECIASGSGPHPAHVERSGLGAPCASCAFYENAPPRDIRSANMPSVPMAHVCTVSSISALCNTPGPQLQAFLHLDQAANNAAMILDPVAASGSSRWRNLSFSCGMRVAGLHGHSTVSESAPQRISQPPAPAVQQQKSVAIGAESD
jgi:hypothetical protein